MHTANLEFHQLHTKTQARVRGIDWCLSKIVQCPVVSPTAHPQQLTFWLSACQAAFWQDFPPKQQGSSPPRSCFETSLARYMAALDLPEPDAEYVQVGAERDCGAVASLFKHRTCNMMEISGAQAVIKRHDFSAARAALVPSVPGSHGGELLGAFGHRRLAAVLGREAWPQHFAGAPLVAQACTFANSLPTDGWLAGEMGASLSAGSVQRHGRAWASPAGEQLGEGRLSIVWPTTEEVRGALDGWFAGWGLNASETSVRCCRKACIGAASHPIHGCGIGSLFDIFVPAPLFSCRP